MQPTATSVMAQTWIPVQCVCRDICIYLAFAQPVDFGGRGHSTKPNGALTFYSVYS